MKNFKVKKKKKKPNIAMLAMLGVVVMLCVILGSQMYGLYKKNEVLSAKERSLSAQIEEQVKRQQELEERRVYIQTDKYAEEVAKSLGYIYPNEIIFKAIE